MGVLYDAVCQIFLQSVIVQHSSAGLSSLVCDLRPEPIAVARVLADKLRHISVLRLNPLRDTRGNCLHMTAEVPCHVFEVMDVRAVHVSVTPVLTHDLFLWVQLNVTLVDRVETAALLLGELAKVAVREVAFVAAIQVFENGRQLLGLELDLQVVKSLLKLVVRDTVVEVDVKEAICLGQAAELLADLDPKEVKELLERTTLHGGLITGRAFVHIRAENLPH